MFIRFLFVVRVAVVVAGAFLFTQTVTASTASIIITEIGAYEPSGQEWLEIYNNSASPVDMEGWVFWENDTNHKLTLVQGADTVLGSGEYAVITQKDDVFRETYPGVSTTIFDSSWGSLKESGELVGLKDVTGEFVEQFSYIAAPSFSLERINYDLADYSSANWQEHADGNTVGRHNSNLALQQNVVSTTTVQIRINEIVSNPAEGENEWVELYNLSPVNANLSGWVLEDGVGVVATIDQTIAASGYLVIELSSSKLNNGGDIVVLKNSAGESIDQIAYGTWDDGNVSDNESAPAKGESLSFIDNAFHISTPTKGAANQASTAEPSSESAQNITAPLSSRSIEASTIVINEFVSDPADGQQEFIELYNRSTADVSLTGWWIEDGGESRTDLSGTIDAKGFVVVEKPKGNLNNAGDQLTLFESTGFIIDQVSYGNWQDGRAYNNAPAAQDPNSVARKDDGYDTDIDKNDFVVTPNVSPGAANAFPQEKRVVENSALQDIDIIISELLPNPTGSDSENEFIELRNNGTQAVNLAGWKIGDGTSKRFVIEDVVLQSNAFITFFRSDTDLALNNSGGDSVVLSANGTEIDRVSYDGRAEEDQVFVKDTEGGWAWSITPTPNKTNIIERPNHAPVAHIEVVDVTTVGELVSFDASDSFDEEGEIISYIWDFGDGDVRHGTFVTHTYNYADTFSISLQVEDAAGVVSETKKEIDVQPKYLSDSAYDIGIRISEFMPNPEGSDAAEFIELVNPTAQPVDISGLLLDDEAGGSYPFVIPKNTVLQPQELLVFEKKKTGLALNNTQDAVRLLYPNEEVIHEVHYDAVIEGASYIEHQGVWVWTAKATPAEPNVFSKPQEKSTPQRTGGKRTKRTKPIVQTTLQHIRDFDPGDRVSVTGTVAVLPGVFGSQYFYIVSGHQPPPAPPFQGGGIQVYQNKKDFPDVAIGDEVRISGSLSQAYGEYRLKVASREDVNILSSGKDLHPQTIDIAAVGETYEGQIVQIHGEITELKSSYLYIDDGTEEIKVYLKKGTGISKKAYQAGHVVSVVGIVSERNGVYQVLPRSSEDISITETSDTAIAHIASAGHEDTEVAEKYLTATAGGLTSILIGLFAKARGALALGFVRRTGSVALGSIRRWLG